MQLKIVVFILYAAQVCHGFFSGLEKSFDWSNFRGPIPTDGDVYRNVVRYELIFSQKVPFSL